MYNYVSASVCHEGVARDEQDWRRRRKPGETSGDNGTTI